MAEAVLQELDNFEGYDASCSTAINSQQADAGGWRLQPGSQSAFRPAKYTVRDVELMLDANGTFPKNSNASFANRMTATQHVLRASHKAAETSSIVSQSCPAKTPRSGSTKVDL